MIASTRSHRKVSQSCCHRLRRASMSTDPAASAEQSVLLRSEPLPEGTPIVRGHDFEKGRNLDAIMEAMLRSGFQATNMGQAVDVVNEMIKGRQQCPDECGHNPDQAHPSKPCKIFLGFTSNLISSGTREILKFLCKNRMIDVMVTTAGGVEEDLIKCLAPTYIGSFCLPGKELRLKGQNRIGNMLVPNNNYCAFEEFMTPILDEMLLEQQEQQVNWTPSRMIARLGERINSEDSVYYWCWKNGIPVYCPAITDGSIGDMIFFHSVRNPGLRCDIIEDIRAMNNEALKCKNPTGAIILGGGLPKHHILNANLMRNGCDFCVLLNTAQEFDGSDSGARPDEAVSWGKIRLDGRAVKVSVDATIGFPLLVSQTFAKLWEQWSA
eukprot:jgi/Ulvmu1/412/UM001_0419.1